MTLRIMDLTTGLEREPTPEESAAWEAEVAAYPPLPPVPYRLYKSVLIRRLTNIEAEALEVILNGEEPWLRMMFNSVEYFMSDDGLFTYLHHVLAEHLEPGRADIVLAPEG